MMTTYRLSVVIPVYNEQENIKSLYDELIQVLSQLNLDYEILFVDDGSLDGTPDLVEKIHNHNERVKLISLGRNFGHQIALSAGLHHASGDIIITMDGDHQHPPQLIPTLIREYLNGHDVVYTTKIAQEKRGPIKSALAFLFYKLFHCISDIEVDPNASDFRLLSRKVLNILNRMPEQQRFIRGLVSWMGFRQTRISYHAPPRRGGKPKYGLRRLAQLASYGIVSFSTIPLRLPLYIGICLTFIGILYGSYMLISSFLYDDRFSVEGLILGALVLMGGLIMGFMGIMGYYLSKIYQEVRRRPLYTVRKTLGIRHINGDPGTIGGDA